MSLAVLFTHHTGKLRLINMCWIFLRVISISDITDFDGSHIHQQSYDGTRIANHPTIRWPSQQRPTKDRWLVYGFCFTSQTTPYTYSNHWDSAMMLQCGTIKVNGLFIIPTEHWFTKSAINVFLTTNKTAAIHSTPSHLTDFTKLRFCTRPPLLNVIAHRLDDLIISK
jgi:hypothetical protein